MDRFFYYSCKKANFDALGIWCFFIPLLLQRQIKHA